MKLPVITARTREDLVASTSPTRTTWAMSWNTEVCLHLHGGASPINLSRCPFVLFRVVVLNYTCFPDEQRLYQIRIHTSASPRLPKNREVRRSTPPPPPRGRKHLLPQLGVLVGVC